MASADTTSLSSFSMEGAARRREESASANKQKFAWYTGQIIHWGKKVLEAHPNNVENRAWGVARRVIALLGICALGVPTALGSGIVDGIRYAGFKYQFKHYKNDGQIDPTSLASKIGRSVRWLLPTQNFYRARALEMAQALNRADEEKVKPNGHGQPKKVIQDGAASIAYALQRKWEKGGVALTNADAVACSLVLVQRELKDIMGDTHFYPTAKTLDGAEDRVMFAMMEICKVLHQQKVNIEQFLARVAAIAVMQANPHNKSIEKTFIIGELRKAGLIDKEKSFRQVVDKEIHKLQAETQAAAGPNVRGTESNHSRSTNSTTPPNVVSEGSTDRANVRSSPIASTSSEESSDHSTVASTASTKARRAEQKVEKDLQDAEKILGKMRMKSGDIEQRLEQIDRCLKQKDAHIQSYPGFEASTMQEAKKQGYDERSVLMAFVTLKRQQTQQILGSLRNSEHDKFAEVYQIIEPLIGLLDDIEDQQTLNQLRGEVNKYIAQYSRLKEELGNILKQLPDPQKDKLIQENKRILNGETFMPEFNRLNGEFDRMRNRIDQLVQQEIVPEFDARQKAEQERARQEKLEREAAEKTKRAEEKARREAAKRTEPSMWEQVGSLFSKKPETAAAASSGSETRPPQVVPEETGGSSKSSMPLPGVGVVEEPKAGLATTSSTADGVVPTTMTASQPVVVPPTTAGTDAAQQPSRVEETMVEVRDAIEALPPFPQDGGPFSAAS